MSQKMLVALLMQTGIQSNYAAVERRRRVKLFVETRLYINFFVILRYLEFYAFD